MVFVGDRKPDRTLLSLRWLSPWPCEAVPVCVGQWACSPWGNLGRQTPAELIPAQGLCCCGSPLCT